MPTFILTNTLDVNLQMAYSVFSNPEAYQMLIPQHYPSVRVLSVRGNTSVAEEHVNLGSRELVVMAKHVADPPHVHETFFIGGDAKGSHIQHKFVENTGNRCTITTTVDLKIGRRLFLSVALRGGMGRSTGDSRHGRRTVQEAFKDIIDDLVLMTTGK